MSDSILKTIKKTLGLDPDYEAFDLEIVTHINSVFSTLHQLGVGPENAFAIEDETATWQDFISDRKDLNSVKSLIYARVRLIFDPPANSFTVKALEDLAKELEWRLEVASANEPLVTTSGSKFINTVSDVNTKASGAFLA